MSRPVHPLLFTLIACVLLLDPVAAVAVNAPTIWDKLIAEWRAPVPPRHLIGNIHYVGAMGVSSFLITTPEGHILLDTGLPDTPAIIERGVKQLGFNVRDIKIILSSHAHFDHVGGLAAMKRLTGARVYSSAADARLLESGGKADFLPLPTFEPVQADQIVADGETVALGGTVMRAHVTPGHTPGATTWTMRVTEAGRTYDVVFFSSTSINPGTRLIDNSVYPSINDDLAATFARLKQLPCDVFFAPHGGQFAMMEKFAKLDRRAASGSAEHPLVDPTGWKALLASSENAYRAYLADETARHKSGEGTN